MVQRKITTQAAIISGLFANTNYDGSEAGNARQEAIDAMMSSTEERFEDQVRKIYGYDTSDEIEQYMLKNDPLFTQMNLEYEEND